MKFSEKLEANYQAGLFTRVQRENGDFQLFSTKDCEGELRRSGWWNIEKDAISCQGDKDGCSLEAIDRNAKKDNWKIVRTIHPSELMGEGYKEGQKVRIKENAEKECDRTGFHWDSEIEQMSKDGFGFIKERSGLDWEVYSKDKDCYWTFPETALEPFFEDKKEEMVTVKISKATLEALKKDGIKIVK